jgi:AraC-like DNA-binding protein
MNLTLPAGGKSPPSSLDRECPQNCIRQKLAGATELQTAAAAQVSDSLEHGVSPQVEETDLRRSEIASRVAYRSEFSFSHAFKLARGICPIHHRPAMPARSWPL